MRGEVNFKGLLEAIAMLNGAGDELHRMFSRTTYRVLTWGLEYLRVTYRTVHSDTSTGIITGLLRRSYAVAVESFGLTIVGRLGILAAIGKVLAYAPVHEFGATYGSRVYKGRPGLDPTAERAFPMLEQELGADATAYLKRAA